MYQDIESVLMDRWVMYYHPAWPITQLKPICSLPQCIAQINSTLRQRGRDIAGWPYGDQDQIARLLWVNWIYNRLPIEPIRKPILVHREKHDLVVDCGDTRLMALELYDPTALVGVVVTDSMENQALYQQWTRIHTTQELLVRAGFAQDASVSFNVCKTTHAIDWLEIGDQTTSHHLHDIEQRIRMITNYVNQQSELFEFDRDWAKSPIDWTVYLPTD